MPVSRSHPSPGETVLEAAELPPLAQRLLAAGEIESYTELLRSLAALEDAQRRHWATLRLIDAGLAASAELEGSRTPTLLAGLGDAVLAALEREPSEPSLLARGASILFALGSPAAARALLEAAERLDPHSIDAERRLAQLSAGRARGRSFRAIGPGAAARSMIERANVVAERAAPARGMRLSLCMIVRDEEEMLPRCLRAVAGAVDEIVVLDTGSRDATIEIARSFGARVIERAWSGSFAEARNASFDAAEGDWVMYLDADEVLVAEDAPLLRSLTGRTWREAFYLAETSYTGEHGDGTGVSHNALRVFRNRPAYRFEGRLHEQIAQTLPTYLPERIEATEIRVEHYGYLAAVSDAREKSRRNIRLLQLQRAETPASAFLHFNLGSEHAAAGDVTSALAEFERSWELVQSDGEGGAHQFAPTLLRRLVAALRADGRPRAALERAEEGLRLFPGFTDLVFEQALAWRALGEPDRAIERCERCIELGDASGCTSRVGCGTFLPRVQLAEIRRERGELDEALELLEGCLREHPQFVGAVLPYAAALLARGTAPDAVAAEVERHLPSPSPTARFILGTALYEAGANVAGETQFRAVLARQPHSARARVALGESLLAQCRYREAAAVAREVPAEDPLAPAACRTELFASIVAGDSAAAALARARAAGLAREELELFDSWSELARGGAGAARLDAASVAPLATMLEALLRVQDFGAFEVLLGLLGRTPLSDRERRDLLAEMYLRRGFAASAAQEWMAICREDPDARALMGLARVAVVRGMEREADAFAVAALERDPENEAAASLLARAQDA